MERTSVQKRGSRGAGVVRRYCCQSKYTGVRGYVLVAHLRH